jgi:hypothetical protein
MGLLVAVLIGGCSSDDPERGQGGRGDPGDTRADAGYPPEDRDLSVTLWPIYSVDDVNAATEDALPTSLAGIEVCAVKARPMGGTFSDFRDLAEPACAVSATDTPIVIQPVPPRSELLVTARKDGYWPTLILAVTGDWPVDVPLSGAPPSTSFRILSRSSAWPELDTGLEDGSALVAVRTTGSNGFAGAPLGGATVSLSRGETEAIHGDGATFHPDASVTFPGPEFDALATVLAWPNVRPRPETLLTRVPEGDHVVRIDHPTAGCETWGWSYGDTIHGYASNIVNEVRLVALGGHFTVITAHCRCAGPDYLALSSSTCAPAEVDGGRD